MNRLARAHRFAVRMERQRGPAAVGSGFVGQLARMPRGAADVQRQPAPHDVRLDHAEFHAAIDARVLQIRGGAPRAPEEIQMAPLRAPTEPLLRSVAAREPQLARFPFGHRHADGDLRLARAGRRGPDVRELEQTEFHQPPLALRHLAFLEEIPGMKTELASHDALTDRRQAHDPDLAERGLRARLRLHGHQQMPRVRAGSLEHLHLGLRIAVVTQQSRRQIPRRPDLVRIMRNAHPDRGVVQQRAGGIGKVREPLETHGLDENRRAFLDADRQVDRILLVVELDVDAGDAGAGYPRSA